MFLLFCVQIAVTLLILMLVCLPIRESSKASLQTEP